MYEFLFYALIGVGFLLLIRSEMKTYREDTERRDRRDGL